jgi:multicomponent K+:H+ antiporter subunit E
MSAPEKQSDLFPHPTLSLVLFVVWLTLSRSLSPGTMVMGAVLAVTIPFFTRAFWPGRPKVRRMGVLIRFTPVFLWDVLVANLRVAWLIVNVARTLKPRWLVIPLELQNPQGITMLANVISLTPGTVSAEVGADRKTLLVHALDVDDPEEEIATIKRRYERPIMEIFE